MSDYTKSQKKKIERKKMFREVEIFFKSRMQIKKLSKNQTKQLKKLIKSVQKDGENSINEN